MPVTIDDLQKLRAEVLRRNPLARSDTVLAQKLFRKALRDCGAEWENAAFDRCFNSLTLRERRDEQPVTPVSNTSRAHVARPASPPSPPPTPNERANSHAAGRSKYDRARDGIMAARFPNGRDLLNQTVAEIQTLGTWASVILRALPKSAKPTDRIGQHLTWDQVTKLRTFEVEHAT